MGRTKGKNKSKGVAPRAAKEPVTPATGERRRDPRPWIYGGLDIVFGVVQAILLWKVVPNRLPSASVHLWTLPLAMIAMGIGTLLRSRFGWKLSVIAGSIAVLSTILLIVRILVSAAFLSGVYGAFGKAAAMTALTAVALIIELVGILPLVQMKYLLSRMGRRAFGVPST